MSEPAPSVSDGSRGEAKRHVYCGATRTCASVRSVVLSVVKMPVPSAANPAKSMVNFPSVNLFSLLNVKRAGASGCVYAFTAFIAVKCGDDTNACTANAPNQLLLKNGISENHDDDLFSRKNLPPVSENPAAIMRGNFIKKSVEAANVPSAR